MVTISIKQAELDTVIKKIEGLGEAVTKRQRKAMLRKAAIIIRDQARANVPISPRPTKIYKSPKLNGKLRAPKGQGRVVAQFEPGTLKDDINVKSLRKSPDLFVGPGTNRGITAFWAAWIEFGNSKIKGVGYMRRAVAAKKEAALTQLVTDARKLFERTIKRLAKQK